MVARAISRPTIPADRALARADAIVAAAAATFARFGLKRTQMADIAAAAAVALGTLYRYSRSKEALFGAALRLALHAPRPEIEAALADPAPSRAAIERFFAAFVAARDFTPRLRAAVEGSLAPDSVAAAAELIDVVGELFDTMNEHALAICLVDVSAREWPELALQFHRGVRQNTRDLLARYLESRCAAGLLVAPPDSAVGAHFVMELCGEFTRGRKHSSPNRGFTTDDVARATVLHVVTRTFARSSDDP